MRINPKYYLLLLSAILGVASISGRKVKQSFKIEKGKAAPSTEARDNIMKGRKVSATEVTDTMLSDGTRLVFSPDSISFAGYEKEAQAATETFIIINRGSTTILGSPLRLYIGI